MTPSAYLIIWLSLALNIFFIYDQFDQWVARKIDLQEQIAESQKEYFDKKLFSEDFALKDYSAAKFTLEQEGKDIIKNARVFHSSPALIKWEAYNEYVCAGYIFELSRIMWDSSAPYLIGMMEQNTKTVADAWQLPYSYEYLWGTVLSDFTWDFSVDEKDYWDVIDIAKLKDFFDISFSEEALFWDIGFFYRDTQFTQDLKSYWNANSHIVKNIWASLFTRKISNVDWKTQNEIISETLSCDREIFPKISDFLQNYELYLDDTRIVLYNDEYYYLEDDSSIWEKVIFTDMSNLKFEDVTLMHFFEGAKVESLFEMTCQWEFFPINIMQINPRFIEKM